MKRISPWLMLSILTPGVCQAYYGSYCCGVRYSPYAFDYRHSGLVSACAEYTPYAFDYRHSGLVEGYGVCYEGDIDYGVPVARGRIGRISRPSFHRARPMRRHAQAMPQPVRRPDGVNIIRGHLLAMGVTSVDINRIFRIDGKLVSADFLLKDRNLIIKYRDPQEIEALAAKEEFKQKIYDNYREDWTQVAASHERNGGEVYYVEASDTETIVAALDSCPMLDVNPGTGAPTVMYAKD